MLRPPTEDIRVVRYATAFGYSAREWSASLRGVDWSRATRLKSNDRRSVWRATITIGGRAHDCVFKVERMDTPWRRFRSFVRATKAHRQWRGAERVTKAGLATSSPIAVLRGRGVEVLVLAYLEGRTLLHVMAEGLSVPDERWLCGEVAETISALMDAGLFHRDFKPSNLIVRPDGGGIGLIDTEGIRSAVPGSRCSFIDPVVLSMMMDLYREPTGSGVRPRGALQLRLCRAVDRADVEPLDPALFKETIRAFGRRLPDPGDLRPEDDPLGQAGAGV